MGKVLLALIDTPNTRRRADAEQILLAAYGAEGRARTAAGRKPDAFAVLSSINIRARGLGDERK
jgi:hypothetical protein